MHFSWMKIYTFRFRNHWSLFPRVQLTIFHHWLRQWLAAGQAPSHYLVQWSLVYGHIYPSLGLNELICEICQWNTQQRIEYMYKNAPQTILITWESNNLSLTLRKVWGLTCSSPANWVDKLISKWHHWDFASLMKSHHHDVALFIMRTLHSIAV